MLTSKDMKTSRKINLASSILALPYLIVNKAYVSAIIFTSSFINTLEAIYKLDYKGKKNIINIEQEPKTETTEVADKEPNNNYTYDNTYTYDENINEEITNQNRHNYTRRKKRF